MRLEQLTFTRFIAAVSIVIFHFGFKSELFNNRYVDYIFNQANIGVSYFFILSGFVMIIAYHKKPKINFFKYMNNRYARIFPVYLFAILLILVIKLKTNNFNFSNFISNLSLLQAWIPSKVLTFNPQAWSLSVEILFYILFPYLYNKIYKKVRVKYFFYLILVFWLVSQIFYHVGIYYHPKGSLLFNFFTYNPLMHLNQFLVGNLAGIYFVRKSIDKSFNLDLWLLFISFLIILALKYPIGLNYHNGLLSTLFIPLILLLSYNNGIISVIFKSKICVFLGEISYGIYILQYPVFSIISSYSLKKYFNIFDETALFLIRLFVLIVLSSITYLIIEKPLRNVIKSKFGNNSTKNS